MISFRWAAAIRFRRKDTAQLGDSKGTAQKRLSTMGRRLAKNAQLGENMLIRGKNANHLTAWLKFLHWKIRILATFLFTVSCRSQRGEHDQEGSFGGWFKPTLALY